MKTKQISPEDVANAKSIYIFGIENNKGKRVFPSLRKVAQMTGVPLRLLLKLSASEEWTDQRYATYQEFYNRLKEERLARLIEQGIDLKDSLLMGAIAGIRLVRMRLGLIARDVQENPTHQKIRGYEMRDLATALETFKRVGEGALGEFATEQEYTWRDILQIARAKQARGQLPSKEANRQSEQDGAVRAEGGAGSLQSGPH